ncbi:hypothetical protein BHM03_00018130 [Ensete ventricosum]|nr:hypothetical protein BHM03_00018130 [Ensete ventricosum]
MIGQDKLRHRAGFERCSEDLAESSLGDSPKGSGSSLGTCQEIAERKQKDSSKEYRRLPDWREFGLG